MSKLYLNKPQLDAELFKCLNCASKPCMTACPVNCSPQEFIQHAKAGEYENAVKSICKNNPMGHTCGLICPDTFCMKACLRSKIDHPINIPLVQATLISKHRQDMTDIDKAPDNGKKVAIIGAGPAGMAAAWVLVKLGSVAQALNKVNIIKAHIDFFIYFSPPQILSCSNLAESNPEATASTMVEPPFLASPA